MTRAQVCERPAEMACHVLHSYAEEHREQELQSISIRSNDNNESGIAIIVHMPVAARVSKRASVYLVATSRRSIPCWHSCLTMVIRSPALGSPGVCHQGTGVTAIACHII